MFRRGEAAVPFRCLVVLPLHPNGRFLESAECHAIMQASFLGAIERLN